MGQGCVGVWVWMEWGVCRGAVPGGPPAHVQAGGVGVSRRQWPAGACTALAEVSAACDTAAGKSTVCKALTPPAPVCVMSGRCLAASIPACAAALLGQLQGSMPRQQQLLHPAGVGQAALLAGVLAVYSIGSQQHEPPPGELSGHGTRQVVGICAISMLQGRWCWTCQRHC